MTQKVIVTIKADLVMQIEVAAEKSEGAMRSDAAAQAFKRIAQLESAGLSIKTTDITVQAGER